MKLRQLAIGFVALSGGFSSLFGQTPEKNANFQIDFNQYQPQKCQGPVPAILTRTTSAKAKEAMKDIKGKSGKRSEKKTEMDHAVESSFFEDQLLTSGQILYGDPMTEYVNNVADELLKDNQTLRDQLQIFVLKSHIPNAYTTHNGIVVVTIGLLARIENESQLAVILAHEIQHFVKKHSLKQYKEVKKTITESRRNYGELESKLKRLYRFSKEQEYEADELGYELVKNSKYDLSEGIYVFEMLKFTEFPFLETTMTLEGFEKPNFKFPTYIYENIQAQLKTAKEFDDKIDKEESDEESSTHPSLDKRIDQLKLQVDKKEYLGRQKFVVGEKDFKLMQQISRFELLLSYIKRADFGRSYYLAKVVELLYGKNQFLNKVAAMSIYGIVEHKLNKHNLDDYGLSVNYNRGDWRPISAAFNKLDSRDFGALASSLIWEIYTSNKSDEFVRSVCDRTFTLIQTKGNFKLKDFTSFKPAVAETEKKPQIDTTATISDGKLKNPRSRIARNSSGELVVNNIYYYGAFYHLTDKQKGDLEKYFDSVKIETTSYSANPSKLSYTEREKLDAVRYARSNKNVQNMVLMQPKIIYSNGKVDIFYDNIETKRNYFAEEIAKNQILDNWNYVPNATNNEVDVLDNSVGKSLKTEDLNRYSISNDWLSERLNNDTNQMILFYKQYLNGMSKDESSPYLLNVNYEYIVIPRPFDIQGLIYSFVLPFYFPFYLAQQFQNDCVLKEKVMAYNTETGRQVYYSNKSFQHKLNQDLLRAHIYKTIYEIKHINGK
jgi:hypothetical protein